MFAMQCPTPSLSDNRQEKYFKNLLSVESPSTEIYMRNTAVYQQIPLLIIKKRENSN